MNWSNRTRLADFRGRLTQRLRRWFLPFAAVFTADLATVVRSWVLRAWFVLTILVALVTMLNHGDPQTASQKPGSAVLAALLHPVDTTTGEAHTLRELLKSYIVIWVSFIIVLSGGTISSELGVVADSVLSRGISRWQYFLGKWTARLVAVLGVYLLVMVPTATVLWLGAGPATAAEGPVATLDVETADTIQAPATLVMPRSLSPGSVAFALMQVAAILAFVVTCGVAFSSCFDSTIISIAVGWVSLYGTGLVLSILDLTRFSPARLIRQFPDVLGGHFIAADQWSLIGGWTVLSLSVAVISGVAFARRDI